MIDEGFRADILVQEKVIVELKISGTDRA